MNKNFIKTPFLALGVVFALFMLMVGIVGYFITCPAPINAWGTTWIEPSDEAATRLDDKRSELEQQIDWVSEGEWLVMQITEEEATSKLHQLARDGNISIDMDYPQIYFCDGIVRVFAQVDVVIDIQLASEAKIDVVDGKPDVTVKSLNLGKIPVPKTLTNTVMTAIEHSLEDRWEGLNVSLIDVTIKQGVMDITLEKE